MTIKSSGFNAHFDNKKRSEKSVVHSNKEIDNSKANNNYSFGGAWEDIKRSWAKRVEQVDKLMPPKRIRKDRVTAVMMEFTCPEAIEQAGKSRDFFAKAHNVLKEQFGKENVHGMCVHGDEQHEYVDKVTKIKKMSLKHAHALITPYTSSKGVNGKQFQTRASMTALNNAMNEMCVKEFGIEYLTNGIARKQKVEELKKESEISKLELELKHEELKSNINTLEQENKKVYRKGEDLVIINERTKNEIRVNRAILKKMVEYAEKNTLVDEYYEVLKNMPAFDESGRRLGMSVLEKAKEELAKQYETYDQEYDDYDEDYDYDYDEDYEW